MTKTTGATLMALNQYHDLKRANKRIAKLEKDLTATLNTLTSEEFNDYAVQALQMDERELEIEKAHELLGKN
jgi:hypothetical protein